jgi:hypothetical protein
MAVAEVRCRICGESRGARNHVRDDGCERCGGSPLCDRCGHQRRDHAGVFTSATGKSCRHRKCDFQSLSSVRCDCAGYVPRTTSFADAAFVAAEPLPPLRIA